MTKITKTDFKFFKRECEYWLKEFGLCGWHWNFDDTALNDCYGECWWDNGGRLLEIKLNKRAKFKSPKEKKEFLKRTAIHECAEILVGSTIERILKEWRLKKYKKVNGEILFEEERHNIIRVMENLLYNKNLKK